jgi:hypothetical protein
MDFKTLSWVDGTRKNQSRTKIRTEGAKEKARAQKKN